MYVCDSGGRGGKVKRKGRGYVGSGEKKERKKKEKKCDTWVVKKKKGAKRGGEYTTVTEGEGGGK